MNITTRVTKLDNPESKLKALATIVLNGNFAVGGIKVIETEKECMWLCRIISAKINSITTTAIR